MAKEYIQQKSYWQDEDGNEHDNISEEGYKENGVKCGEWKYYYLRESKILLTANYKDGKPSGEWNWYYFDGSLKATGTFWDGVKYGLFTYYRENGSKYSSVEYNHGEKVEDQVGPRYWDKNGALLTKKPDRLFANKSDIDHRYSERFGIEMEAYYVTATLLTIWIECLMEKVNIVDNYLLCNVLDDDGYDLFLDQEDKDQINYYIIGAVTGIIEYLRKYSHILIGDEDENFIHNLKLLEWVLDSSYLSEKEKTRCIKLNDLPLTDHEPNGIKYISKGQKDIATWLQNEKFVIKYHCKECVNSELSKNVIGLECGECNGHYRDLDYLYERDTKGEKYDKNSFFYQHNLARDFPEAYSLLRHFKLNDELSETQAMINYGMVHIALKIGDLQSHGFKFKYKRNRLGFRNISHEWTIIRD